jgi:hypothetical protein
MTRGDGDDVRAKLFESGADLNDGDVIDRLFNQYRLITTTSEQLVDRRQTENRFFVTTNALVLSAISFMVRGGGFPRSWGGVAVIGLAFVGVLMCGLWHSSINSYRKLNQTKFDVIQGLEVMLPAKVFTTEWDLQQEKKYTPFTVIEERIPLLFGALHGVALVLGALAAAGVLD